MIWPRSKCSPAGMDTVKWTVVEAWTLEGGRRLRSAVVHSSSMPAFQSPNGVVIEPVVGPIRLWASSACTSATSAPTATSGHRCGSFRCDSDLAVAAHPYSSSSTPTPTIKSCRHQAAMQALTHTLLRSGVGRRRPGQGRGPPTFGATSRKYTRY